MITIRYQTWFKTITRVDLKLCQPIFAVNKFADVFMEIHTFANKSKKM